jgi:PPOX class probable F420-dependent enzyme
VTTLDDVLAIAGRERFLATVATARGDGSIQASLVNAGVMDHPITKERVVAFVTYGPVKLANLRARPNIAITWRSGWEWVTAEGRAELIGPDDRPERVDRDRLRLLLREVFTAAGGTHDNWDEYDRTMAEQGRVAVLVTTTRVYSN